MDNNNNLSGTPRNIIFVWPEEDSSEGMKYSDAITWVYGNLQDKNVLVITMEDVYLLEREILDIINTLNNDMIGRYEDSWICDNEIKKLILKELALLQLVSVREKELLRDIQRFLRIAIETNRNLHFHFT